MRNIYLQLFLTFLKIGAFTFGGGWVMISIIEREVVNKHKWISREDFLDLLAVAQSLPGILAVNFAVAIGDKLRGSRGRLCAALGSNNSLFYNNPAHSNFSNARNNKKQRDNKQNFHGNASCRCCIAHRSGYNNCSRC